MLKVRLGRLYKNRLGNTVTVTRRVQKNTPEYFNGFRYTDDRNRAYKEDGRWSISKEESQHDLIEDVGITVKLGRRYKTDRDHKIFLTHHLDKDHPFHKDGFRFVCEKGRFYRPDGSRCRNQNEDLGNLVEEIVR